MVLPLPAILPLVARVLVPLVALAPSLVDLEEDAYAMEAFERAEARMV